MIPDPVGRVMEFAAYIRHVAVYRALRATNTFDLNPIDVGEPMPSDIIAAVEFRLKQIQAEYERVVERIFKRQLSPRNRSPPLKMWVCRHLYVVLPRMQQFTDLNG